MKKIVFIVTLSCIFLCNCKNSENQKAKGESSEKSDASEVFMNALVQPSRAITYREIEQYLSDCSVENCKALSDYYQNMLSPELRLLRNEFFARKGYIFDSPNLNNYFLKKSWYRPLYTAIDSIVFTKEQQQIVDSLLFYERKNTTLTNEMLKNKMIQSIKNGEKEKKCHVDGYCRIFLSTALFRRNIGYLLVDRNNVEKSEEDMYWIGYTQSLLLIDTVGANKDVLVMDYIYSGSCTSNNCFWTGILFTCDLNFERIIDFRPISFETLIKRQQKTSLLCSFYKSYRREYVKNISIDSIGKITEVTAP